MALRVIYWHSQSDFFRFGTMAAGSLIPVVFLLFTEGMLRRHAPRKLKLYLSVTALALSIGAGFPPIANHDWYVFLIGAFQISGFVLVAILVFTRDRAELTQSENLTIDRLGLALLLLLPFLVFDYLAVIRPMPVRLSGLAILAACWICLSFWRPRLRPDLFGIVLALYFLGAGFAALFISQQFGLGWRDTVQIAAILLATGFFTAICRDALGMHVSAKRNAVFAGIGAIEVPSLTAYLDDLATRGVLDGVLVLNDTALEEFNREVLAERLGNSVSLPISELPVDRSRDTPADSQLRALFERYAATHLVQISHRPLRVAALRQAGLATRELDPDLSAAFRHAQLIAERDRLRQLLGSVKCAPTCL
jgi:hypothetical protein